MRKLLSLLLILICLGCSTQRTWIRPEHRPAAFFQEDTAACATETGTRTGGGFIFGPAIVVLPIIAGIAIYDKVSSNKYEDCMRAKGYKLQGE
jgi:hypothetical protein